MWVQKVGLKKKEQTFKLGPNGAYSKLRHGSCQGSRGREMDTELFTVFIWNLNILLSPKYS